MTPEVLLRVNATILDGRAEIRDPGLVASAADRPHLTMSGSEAYPTIEEKAAALIHAIVRTRPFLRGNKRTAWVAARLMLSCHHKRPGCTATEAHNLVQRLWTDEDDLTVTDIVKTLQIVDFSN